MFTKIQKKGLISLTLLMTLTTLSACNLGKVEGDKESARKTGTEEELPLVLGPEDEEEGTLKPVFITVQAIRNDSEHSALITALANAAPPRLLEEGAKQACAVKSTLSTDEKVCFPIADDGSFSGEIAGVKVGDIVEIWPEGESCSGEFCGVENAIEEVVIPIPPFPSHGYNDIARISAGLLLAPKNHFVDGYQPGLIFIPQGQFEGNLNEVSSFQQLTMADGLPSNVIRKLEADGESFWVGTAEGLAVGRFNSSGDPEFLTVASEECTDPESCMPAMGSLITSILLERENVVWVGTHQGLYRIERLEDDTFSIQHHLNYTDLGANIIQDMEFDGNQGIWVGHDLGVSRFDMVSGVFTETADVRLVTKLFQDASSTLWISSLNNELYYIDTQNPKDPTLHMVDGTNESQAMIDEEVIAPPRVQSIVQNGDGRIWVGTDRGLWRMVDLQMQPVLGTDLESPLNIACLKVLDNHLWIGSQNKYMHRIQLDVDLSSIELETWEPKADFGLLSPVLQDLEDDGRDGAWVATYNGLSHVALDILGELKYKNSVESFGGVVPNEQLYFVKEIGGKLYIASRNQPNTLLVASLDSKGEVVELLDPIELHPNAGLVYEVESDNAGGLLVGSTYGFTHLREDGSSLFFSSIDGEIGSQVRAFFLESSQKVWIGCNDGLYLLEYIADHESSLIKVSGEVSFAVTEIVEQGEGSLLLATSEGLKHATPNVDGSVTIIPIQLLNETCENETSTCNVQPYETGFIYNFVANGNGGYYFTGLNGLGLVENLTAFSSENIEADVKMFTMEDGLPSNYIMDVSLRSDGALWVITAGGMVLFQP